MTAIRRRQDNVPEKMSQAARFLSIYCARKRINEQLAEITGD